MHSNQIGLMVDGDVTNIQGIVRLGVLLMFPSCRDHKPLVPIYSNSINSYNTFHSSDSFSLLNINYKL